MSKIGQKSLDEICTDCLYSSSSVGVKKVEKELTKQQEIKKGMIEQSRADWIEQAKDYRLEGLKPKEIIKFSDVLCQMEKTYVDKNNDYGNSFKELFEEFGVTSSIIRLQDKLSRLKALQKVPQRVTDESQLDTLLDLANYAIMTYVELKNK